MAANSKVCNCCNDLSLQSITVKTIQKSDRFRSVIIYIYIYIYIQGSYRIFKIIFPEFSEFLMISTHFSLSFVIKIDVFFPESVVCKLDDILSYFYFILFYF